MRTYICEIRTEQNNIYIKRDDLFPFSFGGNKARKAVNFFKEIDNGDFDTVVTYGSSSSNHCRVISNMATVRNIPCYIISPEEASEPTYNSKMMQLFGAEITTVPVDEVSRTIDEKLAELRECGRKPYFIPGGGHGNLGTQAYVDCYNEICAYEKRERTPLRLHLLRIRDRHYTGGSCVRSDYAWRRERNVVSALPERIQEVGRCA